MHHQLEVSLRPRMQLFHLPVVWMKANSLIVTQLCWSHWARWSPALAWKLPNVMMHAHGTSQPEGVCSTAGEKATVFHAAAPSHLGFPDGINEQWEDWRLDGDGSVQTVSEASCLRLLISHVPVYPCISAALTLGLSNSRWLAVGWW